VVLGTACSNKHELHFSTHYLGFTYVYVGKDTWDLRNGFNFFDRSFPPKTELFKPYHNKRLNAILN